jgi:hypothetical protein
MLHKKDGKNLTISQMNMGVVEKLNQRQDQFDISPSFLPSAFATLG